MKPGPTLQSLLELARTGTPLPQNEARMLLAHISGHDRVRQIAAPDTPVSAAIAEEFTQLLARRRAGEPIAYLLGQREFYGRSFKVTPAVLIPRPETEQLVELALERLPASGRVLDMGTGSGILPVTLACERPALNMSAVDLSAEALAVAQANAQSLGARVRFLQSDWFSALADERFGLIVSNPPYIAAGDAHLAQGDLRFEPSMALTDFGDGLIHLRTIIRQAPAHLEAGGWLLLEHGYDQGPACRDLLHAAGFVQVQSWQDLAGLDRISGGQFSR